MATATKLKSIRTILDESYMQYMNEFLTIEKFAEYHNIDIPIAQVMIDAGRKIHDENVELNRIINFYNSDN